MAQLGKPFAVFLFSQAREDICRMFSAVIPQCHVACLIYEDSINLYTLRFSLWAEAWLSISWFIQQQELAGIIPDFVPIHFKMYVVFTHLCVQVNLLHCPEYK